MWMHFIPGVSWLLGSMSVLTAASGAGSATSRAPTPQEWRNVVDQVYDLALGLAEGDQDFAHEIVQATAETVLRQKPWLTVPDFDFLTHFRVSMRSRRIDLVRKEKTRARYEVSDVAPNHEVEHDVAPSHEVEHDVAPGDDDGGIAPSDEGDLAPGDEDECDDNDEPMVGYDREDDDEDGNLRPAARVVSDVSTSRNPEEALAEKQEEAIANAEARRALGTIRAAMKDDPLGGQVFDCRLDSDAGHEVPARAIAAQLGRPVDEVYNAGKRATRMEHGVYETIRKQRKERTR